MRLLKTLSLCILCILCHTVYGHTFTKSEKKHALLLAHPHKAVQLYAEYKLQKNVKKLKLFQDIFKQNKKSTLIKAIQGRSAWLAFHAIKIVSKKRLFQAIPALAKALKSKNIKVRRVAAETLFRLGRGLKPALKNISKGLRDRDFVVRAYCAKILCKMGIKAAPALKNIMKALPNNDRPIQIILIKALTKMGPKAAKSTSMLVKMLKTSDKKMKHLIIHAISRFGAQAYTSVKPLIKLAKKSGYKMRDSIAIALKNIGHSAVEELTKLLFEQNLVMREYGAFILGNIGSKDAVVDLKHALKLQVVKTRFRLRDVYVERALRRALRKING